MLDHPKDLIFVSNFFGQFYQAYAREGLFGQTISLLYTTTDAESLLEVARAVSYLYNSLKFKNHVFNFKELLEKEKLMSALLEQDAIKALVGLTLNAPEALLELCVICLTSIVKYFPITEVHGQGVHDCCRPRLPSLSVVQARNRDRN